MMVTENYRKTKFMDSDLICTNLPLSIVIFFLWPNSSTTDVGSSPGLKINKIGVEAVLYSYVTSKLNTPVVVYTSPNFSNKQLASAYGNLSGRKTRIKSNFGIFSIERNSPGKSDCSGQVVACLAKKSKKTKNENNQKSSP